MELDTALEEIVRNVNGALACLIVGKDGIVVSEYHRLAPSDLGLLAAEYSRVCGDASNLMNQLSLGNLHECSFSTEKLSLYTHLVNSHFIMLITLQETTRGEALFKLDSLSKKLAMWLM